MHITRRPFIASAACALILAAAGPVFAQADAGRDWYRPIVTKVGQIDTVRVSLSGRAPVPAGERGSDCFNVQSHTGASFGGGTYAVQAGMVENEIAAASYTLPADAFPIKIELLEFIIATENATQQTVTEYSIMVWDGPPNTGVLVANYQSDDLILPHVRVGPGTGGVNLQVSVDPGDPEQIILTNDSGTNTFSIGFRIDNHNAQPPGACSTPPSSTNAFPATDQTINLSPCSTNYSFLQAPTQNWVFAVSCPFGCPAGWNTFSQYPVCCRPHGDWVMRATWSSISCQPGVGACCLPTGACEVLPEADCVSFGGTFQGDGSDCGSANCPAPTGACCFEATGGCINLTADNCFAAGGVWAGAGTNCGTFVCFPMGACCLVDGTCLADVSPGDCAAAGGAFRGDGTSCSPPCPLPMGACCFGNGFCLSLTEADCAQAGASWAGAGTDCADGDGNGTADECESPPPLCPCDWNEDGSRDTADFFEFFGAFFAVPPDADYNDDGVTNSADFFEFFGCFFDPEGC